MVFTQLILHLSENSGGVRILRVCGFAAHSQNAVLILFSDRILDNILDQSIII